MLQHKTIDWILEAQSSKICRTTISMSKGVAFTSYYLVAFDLCVSENKGMQGNKKGNKERVDLRGAPFR